MPNGDITTTVKQFVDGQAEWFTTGDWGFESNIIKHDHGKQMGYVLVIADYREPNRDGKPYHHKMFISYDLKKINDKWIIVKDHASTIKKTH